MAEIKRLFMFNQAEDAILEQRNGLFWRALLGHVQADRAVSGSGIILDIGCHYGGLLELYQRRFKASRLIGIEPLKPARDAAQRRLSQYQVHTSFFKESEWDRVADASVDLVLSHEVVAFIEDLDQLVANIRRVLKPAAFAYMVTGCHLENPLWGRWRKELEEQGHVVYDHAPIDFMKMAGKHKLAPAVRPLRDSGWAYCDPYNESSFPYPSVQSLLDHQFKHKLLFRFQRMAS